MPKLDFVELDRILSTFFEGQGMADAGYVVVLANHELKLGITSNVPDTDMVKGMLRGAIKSVENIEPMFIDTMAPAAGNA